MNIRIGGVAALALAALPFDAAACGGFFCNNNTPVVQSSEVVVFSVDETTNTVESHVQIFFEGASTDFAWVIPVSSVPDLFLSTDALFDELDAATEPLFEPTYRDIGDCSSAGIANNEADMDGDGIMDISEMDPEAEGTVTVIDEQQVGPYDSATLQAADSFSLMVWLQNNGYDLPGAFMGSLEPYIAADQYFVALKLANDRDAGDIAPLGLRYTGSAPAVPIQLTAVAAAPDMRMQIYLFGNGRGLPTNYLHVQINEAAIDWSSNGGNYEDVITLAADQAGGHAFATDFAGSTAPMQRLMYEEGRYDTDAFRSLTGALDALMLVQTQGYRQDANLLAVLADHAPVPFELLDSGVTPEQFYACPDCYAASVTGTVDGEALADDLAEFIVAPLINAEKLFADNTHVTRLRSSMSAAEMTIDPMFGFNADLDDVGRHRTATIARDCTVTGDGYTAPRTIELQDGRDVLMPSESYFGSTGIATTDFMTQSTDVWALVIEQLSTTGEEVIVDNNEPAGVSLTEHNIWVRGLEAGRGDEQGCSGGCSSTGDAAGGWALLGLIGLLHRRR